jgi:hypothetical protein
LQSNNDAWDAWDAWDEPTADAPTKGRPSIAQLEIRWQIPLQDKGVKKRRIWVENSEKTENSPPRKKKREGRSWKEDLGRKIICQSVCLFVVTQLHMLDASAAAMPVML